MAEDDVYRTISGPCEGVFRDKGSKFIGYAYPIDLEAEIKDVLAGLRTEHPKARHFCWAYRLGQDKSIFRLNDDGEPSGSAGRPILNTLLSENLTNILVVVVRYFGGTLLGVPGLIHAYKSATAEAIGSGEMVLKTVDDIYFLSFPYDQTNEVMKVVKEEKLIVKEQKFDMQVELNIRIRQSLVKVVLDKLHKIRGLDSLFVTAN
jgi:uncharacterized YigZ family protein